VKTLPAGTALLRWKPHGAQADHAVTNWTGFCSCQLLVQILFPQSDSVSKRSVTIRQKCHELHAPTLPLRLAKATLKMHPWPVQRIGRRHLDRSFQRHFILDVGSHNIARLFVHRNREIIHLPVLFFGGTLKSRLLPTQNLGLHIQANVGAQLLVVSFV